MRPTRYFIAILLLVFSSQSLALFMPAGTQIGKDTVVTSNDESC